MSAVDLVRELESVGVRLWEDEGRLRFRAPKGLMTDERLEALRANKEDVLAYIRLDEMASALTPEPASRFEPFPLTDVQAAYLLGRRDVFDFGRVACHGYGELEFAELDPKRVERAWQATIDRHDMLRAVIELPGSQRVLPERSAYEVAVEDLRGAAGSAVSGALIATRDEMGHRVHDPGSWPLFELRITLTDAKAYLHLSIDFLIADFISIQLLLDELHRRYADPETAFEPLEPSFRDYLVAERRVRSGPAYERDRAWWLQRLPTLPPAPELPLHERARESPPRFERHQLWLEPDAWEVLKARAGARAITPSCAVLAAYSETIARWSRRREFTLNVTVLGRLPLHRQVDQLVGDFTSVELLEVRQAPQQAFAQRAGAVQARLWEDLDHRLFSGVELLREIARREDGSAPLYPIVYTSAVGLGEATGRDAGVTLGELGYGISQTPQVWIDCQVMERQGRLSVNWDVRVGVLPDGVVPDMFAAFEELLTRLATGEEAWEATEPIALPAAHDERRRVVNATAGALPDGLLHEGFVRQARRERDRVAVIDGRSSLSYGELLGLATAGAQRLRAEGCSAGERIAVVIDKGSDQVVAVLAVLLAGAAYVPVDTNQPAPRRRAMLATAGVRRVLTQSSLLHDDWPDDVQVFAVEDLVAGDPPDRIPPPQAMPDDLAYVIFTSGSTGNPKGVMITHRAALNTIEDVSRRFGVGPEDRVLGLAALGFDLSVYDLFATLALGGSLVLPDAHRRGDPSHWAELIAGHGVTLWNSVPAQLQMLHDYLRGEPDVGLPSLRLALLSGDWIPVALPNQVRGRLPGLALVSLGGATEAAIWSIFHPIEEVPDSWHSIPYGRPPAGQSFHVLDEHLRPCPDWVTGELYIGGAGLALGYISDEQQTAARFIQHPDTGERLYRTGDLGRYLPDGEIEFLGREDFQVKIRGHRIELAEIEATLTAHPGVGAATVLAHGDGALDRHLTGFVEPARRTPDAHRTPAAAAVQEAARGGGDAAITGVDTEQFLAYMEALNGVALLSMVRCLRAAGLFVNPGDSHSAGEIVERTQAAPANHRLVRRWLRALSETGTLERDGDGNYYGAPEVSEAKLEQAWRHATELQRGVDDGAGELLDYFKASAAHLPGLLRGERGALQLMFPDGRLDVAESLYGSSLINRWSTAMMASAIREIADARPADRPLRVLEVGAGVGGSTLAVLAALAEYEVDYLFTDLSRFFINLARERLAGNAGVRYGVYDLEGEPRAQGMEPNSFDVILAADVLHSTRHAGEALARLRTLAAPGGWLVFVEMTRDQYQIMASLELLTRVDEQAHDFVDVRRGRDQTFLSEQEWLEVLGGAGIEPAFVLPDGDDQLAQLGMHVFGAELKADRARLRVPELRRFAGERLPEYMVPPQLQIVDALPLTANGKIDQRALRSWVSDPRASSESAGAAPESELEQRVAAAWAEMFGLESVPRDVGFFDLGGDSLLAAQVTGRLREVVPEAAGMFFDDLLRKLLEGPDVAQLAVALASATPFTASEPQPDLATPLQWIGAPAPGTPCVLVHGREGTLDRYGVILDELDGHGPRLAFRAVEPVDDAFGDYAAVQRLAAGYARLLLSEGHLAVHLVGFGSGALLALEVARNLIEAGAEVDRLTVMGSAADDGGPSVTPDVYLGDIRLLEPAGDSEPERERVAQLWSECCLGELEIVAVPGTGAGPTDPTHARALATALAGEDPLPAPSSSG